MDDQTAERLTNILENFHKLIVIEIKKQRNRAPTEYKRYERYKISRFFLGYDPSSRTLVDIAADMLSTLLRAHPFPNANHRTMLYVTKAFFESNGFKFPSYEKRRQKWERHFVHDCNRFFHRSKYWLRIRFERKAWKTKLKAGKKFMYFQSGGKLVVREPDLELSNAEIAKRHRDETQRWLKEMLGDQSERSRKTVPDALTRFIAQAERVT